MIIIFLIYATSAFFFSFLRIIRIAYFAMSSFMNPLCMSTVVVWCCKKRIHIISQHHDELGKRLPASYS